MHTDVMSAADSQIDRQLVVNVPPDEVSVKKHPPSSSSRSLVSERYDRE